MGNDEKQGWIPGNPVVDGWAGAVMKKTLASLAIFLTDQRTDRPKLQVVE